MINNIFKIIIFSSLYLESNSFILKNNIISNYNHKKYTSNYDKYYNLFTLNVDNYSKVRKINNIIMNFNNTDKIDEINNYEINNDEIDNDKIDNDKINNINDFNNFINNKYDDYNRKNNIKKDINLRKDIEKYSSITPSSKDLKLLNDVITVEWSKNWIYDMVHYTDTFPRFMYQDMFLMRDFANENTSKRYFYIGYFPSDIRCIHGPYYIGAFELVPNMREFNTHLLVQNPNYMIENEYDENKILDFKRELIKMTQDALVFFKFSKLKKGSNDRYYYSWLYGDE